MHMADIFRADDQMPCKVDRLKVAGVGLGPVIQDLAIKKRHRTPRGLIVRSPLLPIAKRA